MCNCHTMRIKTKSVTYDAVWQIKGMDNYVVTADGKVINKTTGKVLQRQVKGYSIGYYLNGRFYTLQIIRKQFTKIQVSECPF